MGQLGLAFRLSRRQARHQRLRTIAIVATLTLPVAVVTAVDVVVRSVHLSQTTTIERQMGGAQALVEWSGFGQAIVQTPWGTEAPAIVPGTNPATANPAANGSQSVPAPAEIPASLLPAGATAYREVDTGVYLVSPANGVYTNVEGVDIAAPPLTKLVHVQAGRAPENPGEVALTTTLAHQLSARIGSELEVPSSPMPLRVVGLVTDRYGPRDSTLYALPVVADALLANTNSVGSTEWLLSSSSPVTWPEVLQLDKGGFVVISKAVLQHPPPASQLATSPSFGVVGTRTITHTSTVVTTALLVTMALLEVILLAGPAFAVGARRRRYELALLSASGGTRRQLVTLVAADGVVLGAIAAATGTIGGIVAGSAVLAGIPHWTNRVPGAVQVVPRDLIALAALALLTGLVAALIPALSASRRVGAEVVRGRLDQSRLPLKPAAFGAITIAVAVILAAIERNETSYSRFPVLLVLAAALGEVGFALISPALLTLVGRPAAKLPLWPRLALRDASRNRSAAAPAVAAILAVVAATSALLVFGSSLAARDRVTYQASALVGDASTEQLGISSATFSVALAQVRANLPGATVFDLDGSGQCNTAAGCRQAVVVPPQSPGCTYKSPLLSGGGFVTPLVKGCPELTTAGAAGFYLVADGSTANELIGGTAGIEAEKALDTGRAVVFTSSLIDHNQVALQMSPGDPTHAELPATLVPNPTLALLYPVVISPDVANRLGIPFVATTIYVKDAAHLPGHALRQADLALSQLGFGGLSVERGFRNHTSPILLAVAGGDLLLTLGAAIAATALIAVDDRDDLLTLAAVGAAPRTRRRLAMARAGIICSLGAVFGTLAGLLPGVGLVLRLRHLNGLNNPVSSYLPDPGYPLSIPWVNLGLIALVAPILAILAAALITRARLPIERRRSV